MKTEQTAWTPSDRNGHPRQKRLKPWVHFWVVVPIILSGIGGTVSVVAANAWMNEPGGFTLDSAGKVTDVEPLNVIFNSAMPLEALHMLIAAYLVTSLPLYAVRWLVILVVVYTSINMLLTARQPERARDVMDAEDA